MSKKSHIPLPQSGHNFEFSFENSPQPLATSSVNRTKQHHPSNKPLLQKINGSVGSIKASNKDAAEISAIQKKINEIKASNNDAPPKLDRRKQRDVLEQLEEIQQSLDEKYKRLSNNAIVKSECRAKRGAKHGGVDRSGGSSEARLLQSDLLVPGILDFDRPRARQSSSVSSLGIVDENSSEFNAVFQGVNPDENFDAVLQSRPIPQSADSKANAWTMPGESQDKRLTHNIPEAYRQSQDENRENVDPNDPSPHQHRKVSAGNRVKFDTRENKRPYNVESYTERSASRSSIHEAQLPCQLGLSSQTGLTDRQIGPTGRQIGPSGSQMGTTSQMSLTGNQLGLPENIMVPERDCSFPRSLESNGADEWGGVSSRPSIAQSRLSMQRRLAQLCLNEEANGEALHTTPSRETFDVLSPPSNLVTTDESFSALKAQQAELSLLSEEFDTSGSKFLATRADRDHEEWVRSRAPMPLLESEMRAGSFSLGGQSGTSFAPSEYFGSESIGSVNLEELLQSQRRRPKLPLNTTITLTSSEDERTLRGGDSSSELDEACAMTHASPLCTKSRKDTSLGNSTQAVMRRYEEDRESLLSSVSSVVSTTQLARILEQHSDLDCQSAVFQEFLQEVSSKNSSKKSSQRGSPCSINSQRSSDPSRHQSAYRANPDRHSISGASEEFFLLNRPESASSMRGVDSPRKSSFGDASSSGRHCQNSTVCLESAQGVPPSPHQYIFYLTSPHSTSAPLTPLLLDPPSRRSTAHTRYGSSVNSMLSDDDIDGEFVDRRDIDSPLGLNRAELVRDFKRKLSSKLSDLSGLRLRLSATLLNSTCDEADLTIASLCQSSTRCDLAAADETDIQDMDLGYLCIGTTAMISKNILNPCSYLIKCYAELQSVSDPRETGVDSTGDEGDGPGGDSGPALVLFETDRFDIHPGEQKTAKIYIIPLRPGPLTVQYRFRLVHTFTSASPVSHSAATISYRTNRVRLVSEIPRIELRVPELGSVNFGIRPSRFESSEQLVLVNRGHSKVPLRFVLEAVEGEGRTERGGRGEFRATTCVDPDVQARFDVHVNTPDIQSSKFVTLTGRLQILLDVKEPIACHLTQEISLLLHHVHLSTRVTSTPLLLSADHLELTANVPQQLSLKNVTSEPLTLKLWIPEDRHEEILLDPSYIARTPLNKVYTIQVMFQPRVNARSDRKLVLMIDYNPRTPNTHCFPIHITGLVGPSHTASSNQSQYVNSAIQTNRSNHQHTTDEGCRNQDTSCETPANAVTCTPSQSAQTFNEGAYKQGSQTHSHASQSNKLHEASRNHATHSPAPSASCNNFSQVSNELHAYNPSQGGVSASQPPRSGTPLNYSPRARQLRTLAPSPSLSVASADGSPLELDCTRSHLCWPALGGGPTETPGSVSLKLRNRNRHREKLNLALMNRNHCFKILKDKEPVTELKISLAPMECRDVTVTFVPSTSTGAMSNAIVITRVNASVDTGDEDVPKRVIPLYGFSGRSKVDISGVQKDINQRMIISLTSSSVQALFTLSNSGQASAFALIRSSNSRLLRVDSAPELLLTPNPDPQIVELSLALSEFNAAAADLLAGRAGSDVIEIARVTIVYGEESARARLKRIVSRLPSQSPVLRDYPYLPDVVNMFGGEVFCNTKKLRDSQEMLGSLYTKDVSQVTIGILMDKADIEMILLDTTVVFEELNSTLYKTHLPSE